MPNRDLVLLESVRTHRARLTAAFVYGEQAERRAANDNVRRLVGGVVLAAVLCAGCVGFSLVSGLLAGQAADRAAAAGLGPATGTVFAADTFDRTADQGWGAAERGGDWTLTGPRTDYAVADGAATMTLPNDQVRGGYLGQALQDHSDLTVVLQRRRGAGSGDVAVEVVGRRVSSTQAYRTDVALGADGSLALAVSREAEPEGLDAAPVQTLSATVILFGADPESVDAAVAVRMQVVGTAPTTVRAKAWPARSPEPSDWTVSASDESADLQRPGSVGLSAVRRGGDDAASLAVTDLVAREAP